MPTVPLAGQPGLHSARRLALHGPDDAERGEVESFIRGVFAQRFGAALTRFAPKLVSLRDDTGIVAAAGYRPGNDGTMFLERYLDAPVEQALASFEGSAPARASIVEVGHLAAARAGEGRRLILQLGPHLAAQGFQWVVSTLTEELRQLFVRLGVVPYALGRADAAALGEAARDWGSYYEHRPVVLAGQLPLALRQRGLVDHGGTA
jgi:hypothetical protein